MPDNTPATKEDFILLQQDIAQLRGATAELREATKQDIAQLREATAELREATKQDIAQLREATTQLSETLVEQMRDMQTEVLRAFHSWARPADVKLRSHEERLALLEERVYALERGEFPRSQ
jgi:hypothetical protein